MTDRRAFIITGHCGFLITDRLSFIITENHSCDTYVGRFPGADGTTVGRTATACPPVATMRARI